MNFEPKSFFIGLMDFFSILLPGALLTYRLMGDVGPVVPGDRYARLGGAEAWAAFLLGSWLDEFCDRARRYTLNAQITRLARCGRLLPWTARALIWLVFKGERSLAVDRATKIKQQARRALQANNAINNSQWCKARAECPESCEFCRRSALRSRFQVRPLLCTFAPGTVLQRLQKG